MKRCKCGCGTSIPRRRTFLNKAHQLAWMNAGGARELNALLPDEARKEGGRVSGMLAAKSGRLKLASKQGVARIREIVAEMRTGHQ